MIKKMKTPVQLYKKGGLPFIDKDGYVYAYGHDGHGSIGWLHIDEVRPLTKREKGEA